MITGLVTVGYCIADRVNSNLVEEFDRFPNHGFRFWHLQLVLVFLSFSKKMILCCGQLEPSKITF